MEHQKIQVSDEPISMAEREDEKVNSTVIVKEEAHKKSNNVFSKDDEIMLLRKLIDFRANDGVDNDWVGFHLYLQHPIFSKRQVFEKIRKLKHKFERAKKKGYRSSSSSDKQNIVFELSSTLWGVEDKKEKKVSSKDDDDVDQQWKELFIQEVELSIKKSELTRRAIQLEIERLKNMP